MPEKFIHIQDMSHVFPDGTAAIEDINLTIHRGECILLAGKNGSGKTTLIRHLNGLLAPSKGNIYVNGRPVAAHLLETRKTIGMVFQDADTQIVADTVFDEAAFGLENLKADRQTIKQKVTMILEQLNLAHLKHKPPSVLSGGEKRKLAIAGVLVMRPEMIVFDEPFSNLDYPGTLEVLSTIVGLNRSGQTIVVATHDVEPVICEATRMIIMENGQIVKDASPDDIKEPLEAYGIKSPCAVHFGKAPVSWLI
jgi:biotin transport system ATP-binding protein